MTRWRQEQLRLENAYARAMLHEDGIVEVTTKRQWKTVHVNLNYQQDKC